MAMDGAALSSMLIMAQGAGVLAITGAGDLLRTGPTLINVPKLPAAWTAAPPASGAWQSTTTPGAWTGAPEQGGAWTAAPLVSATWTKGPKA